MTGLDTNILVRYLTQDDPIQNQTKRGQKVKQSTNKGEEEEEKGH